MELLLIRHAKAEDGSLYGDDSERPLTAEGRRGAGDVGNALARAGVALDRIVTSPMVRAVETAELVAVAIGYPGALGVSPLLLPDERPSHVIERLIATLGVERAALVGHEPSMGRLLSHLLERPGLAMSKGAAAKLRFDGKRARLEFVVKPRRLDPTGSLDAL
jgi:phosphohistidine phosphatase